MPRVIGIDLGTTNSCVALVEGMRARVVPNRHGYDTTPSVVAVSSEGERLVGQLAVRQAITNPEHTAFATKRLLGRAWGSEEVERARTTSPFAIVEGPLGDVRVKLGGRQHSVPELSAIILMEMRVIAEDFLGERVDRAVVTVPAYFNDAQRQAVRDAGRIAGLEVLRILNEPTAAALAYRFGKADPKTVAVYDLGGGTFDLSIVRIDARGELHVVATLGDSFLGGEDFDHRVMKLLVTAFEEQHAVDLAESPTALARVREAAQKAKADLSTLTQVEIFLPFLVTGPQGPLHLERVLTREQLEEATADLVQHTIHLCQLGLSQAGLSPREMDEVLMVGGQTRMPAIRRAVAAFFEREPCKGVHPDEAVALGAAIAAEAIAAGDASLLHDVTAHSLGIMTADGRFDPLILANTPVPISSTTVFGTSRDGQGAVKILVLQGESPRAQDNCLLGRFTLSGLREAPAGQVEVAVTFRIDEDGIVSVAARDAETGAESSIDVVASSGMSEEELRRMMEISAEHLATRRAQEAAESRRQLCRVLLREVRQRMPEAERKMERTPRGLEALRKVAQAAEIVDGRLDEADLEALDQQLALLERIQTMLAKVLAPASGS